MKKSKKVFSQVLSFVLSLILVASLLPAVIIARAETVSYTKEAKAIGTSGGYDYPGVFTVKADKNDKVDAEKKTTATLGIPDVAKQNLEDGPTKVAPAIIMGAAVPYEIKTGPAEYSQIPGGKLYAPYSNYRYKIIEEPNQGGQSGTHKKLSGFDGTYYIIRVDVSDIIAGAPEGSYLHVLHDMNKVLMVQTGYDESENKDQTKAVTFASAGSKSACYSLANDAEALKDVSGGLTDTPYVDIIVFSSGTGVAGADTGSADPTAFKADFSVKFYVDQTADYNPELVYDPTSTDPEHAKKVMAKYYDDSKLGEGTDVYGYTVKGSDLEIEIIHDDDKLALTPDTTFWSLRKAMNYQPFDGTNIKMICEVPVLEGLSVEGTAPDSRNIIFDVNSFDIQIANHQTTGAAGLTVKNATLTLTDSFNTTGAELAVGNNASMAIKTGGKLIISDQCQLEVEYDAASVAPSETDPTPTPVTYDSGIITIEDGGEIVNEGVISIEGTEGKPIDPAAPAVRDAKSAKFYIQSGGKLTNKGCLLSYGELYNMGTIDNSGKYTDLIESNDPDKGKFTYHKGIQISWKDDVTQDSIDMGILMNGKNGPDETAKVNPDAAIINSGDIVMVPGIFDNYATVTNSGEGNIYLCPVYEAVIPTAPRVDQPTVLEKRIQFDSPMVSYFYNNPESVFVNDANFAAATVEIVSNGRTGSLAETDPKDMTEDLHFYNEGSVTNSGKISLYNVYTVTEMTNAATGTIQKKVTLVQNGESEGVFIDESKSITEVYDAVKKEEENRNVWTYTERPLLTVTPVMQERKSKEKAEWKVCAVSNSASDINYSLDFVRLNSASTALNQTVSLKPNEEKTVLSPELPDMNGNITFRLYFDGYPDYYQDVTVKVTSDTINAPEAIEDLVYNGKEQELIIPGYSFDGTPFVYRLGTAGEWSESVPTAKDAGKYEVYYKLSTEDEARGNVIAEIGKRKILVTPDDIVSKVNEPLKPLTYTVSGVLEGDESPVVVELSTTADNTKPGTYPISVGITVNPGNYDILDPETGSYTVTESDFEVIAKDTYGVFSDDISYKGFNIDLTVSEGAVAYYSTSTELNKDNYKTAGALKETFILPAGAGVHRVYYYVASADESYGVKGSRRVFIDKATKAAPDKITAEPETAKGRGDGIIKGLVARETEFRNANTLHYQTAYYDVLTVPTGVYYVRYMADENHYASPAVTVTVAEGEPLSVTFDSNGGSEVAALTGLSYGDLVTEPAAPVYDGFTFDGWFTSAEGEEAYIFGQPILENLTLYAHWAEIPPAEFLKQLITESEEFKNGLSGNEQYASIVSELESAITAAKAVADNTSSTKEDLENAIKALKDALKKAKDDKAAIDAEGMFYDVKYGTWQYDSAKAAYDKGIMTGTGTQAGKIVFSPNTVMNRSQFVTALYGMDGKPEISYEQKFGDVTEGKWYSLPITWASQNGIVAGNPDGTFGVNGKSTREQIALMLYRYAEFKKYDVSIKETTDLDKFTDKDKVDDWALTAVKWAVERGIISGKGNAETGYRIDPTKSATRIEVAAMLNKFSDLYDGALSVVLVDEEEPIALPEEQIEDIPVPDEEDVIIDDEDIPDEDEIIDDEDNPDKDEIIDDEDDPDKDEIIDDEDDPDKDEIIDNEDDPDKDEVIDNEDDPAVDSVDLTA